MIFGLDESPGFAALGVAEGERRGRTYRLADHLATGSTTDPAGELGTRRSASAVERRASSRSAVLAPRKGSRTNNAAQITAELRSSPKTAAELVAATGLTGRQVKYALQLMRESGLVTLIGSRGQNASRYLLRP